MLIGNARVSKVDGSQSLDLQSGVSVGNNILDTSRRTDYTLIMATITHFPKTLLEAVTYFADADVALAFMANIRWPDGVRCPRCDSDNVPFVKSRRIWQCKSCRKQFSAKAGTLFEDSPIPLSKWWPAYWMLCSDKNGISSYELARAIGVTQKTAWFILHRLRLALQTSTFTKMGGTVEIDETFIGGKARFMHKERRQRMIKGRGPIGKVAVIGLLERHSTQGHSAVLARVVGGRRKEHLKPHITQHVKAGTTVYTDELRSYEDLSETYVHGVINHAEAYVDGQVHTNGMEKFWSLLKRAIKGTYVSVEPFHLVPLPGRRVFPVQQPEDVRRLQIPLRIY